MRGCPQLRADTGEFTAGDGGAHVQAEDELRDEIRRQYDASKEGLDREIGGAVVEGHVDAAIHHDGVDEQSGRGGEASEQRQRQNENI